MELLGNRVMVKIEHEVEDFIVYFINIALLIQVQDFLKSSLCSPFFFS